MRIFRRCRLTGILLTVSLAASAAVNDPVITNQIFAKSLSSNGCDQPAAASYFTTSDPNMYLWITVTVARSGDTLTVGSADASGAPGSYTPYTYPSAGSYCHSFPVTLANLSDKNRIGDWTFKISFNGSQFGTAATVVLGPSQPRIDTVEVYGNSLQSRLSPGTLAILRGANLAASAGSASAVPLHTSLNGTTVIMNGAAVPIFYADSSSAYVQVPAGIRADSVGIRLYGGAGGSNLYRAPLGTVSPSVFPDPNQAGQAQIFRFGADGSSGWVNPGSPLQRGDTAVLVAGGLGPAAHPPNDGQAGSSDSAAVFSPQVSIAGVSATMQGSYLGSYPGLYWVYFQVPPEVPSGAAVAIHLSVNGIMANDLTVPIQGPGPSFPAITVTKFEHPAWNGPARDNGVYNATSLIAMTATNLRPDAPAILRCSSPSGFQVDAPVTGLMDGAATAIVPPYVDPSTSAYASGTVSCALAQKLADQTVISNSFQFVIQAPPVPTGNPGALTLAMAQAGVQGARRVEGNLTLKDRAAGGTGFSSANTRAEMNGIAAAYAPYIDAISQVSSGSAQSVTVGTGANGQPVTISRNGLMQTDRWIAMVTTEMAASVANAEEFFPPGTPLSPNSRSSSSLGSSGFKPRGIFSSLGTLIRQCANIPGYFSYYVGKITGDPAPNPADACTALSQVPAIAAESLYEAAQSTSRDVARTVQAAAYVTMLEVVPAEAFEPIVTRLTSTSAAIQAGAAVIAHVAALTQPDTIEDRAAYLDETRGVFTEYLVDHAKDFVNDLTRSTVEVIGGTLGTTFYDAGNKFQDLWNKAQSLIEKEEDEPAEMSGDVEVQNADGSYSLMSDPAPGDVNVVSGTILAADNGPAADSYIELSDGSQIDTPYGVAALNPDGSFQIEVPADQVGAAVPTVEPIWLNAPISGGLNYKVYGAGTTPVGTPLTTIPIKQIPGSTSSSGGGSGDSGCPAVLVNAGLAC